MKPTLRLFEAVANRVTVSIDIVEPVHGELIRLIAHSRD